MVILLKKYKSIFGKILHIFYKKIVQLKSIKKLESKNKDIFINILDTKLLGKISKKNHCLQYSNLKIEKSNKPIFYSNSLFYTSKDKSFILHYREFKPKKKPIAKIFLVHGFGVCTSFYDNLIEKLVNDGYYCLSFDLPGWGLSSKCDSYTQEIRATQITELLKFINQKNNDNNKWIAIGHSMGGGCILNMKDELMKEKIVFNPAIKPIINNFFKLSNKYITYLLDIFSNKRWFMDNVFAFIDKETMDENIYNDILNQLPDSFTIVKTLIEGFETSNLIEKNKNIPISICVSNHDTIIGNHEGIMAELLTLSNISLTEVEGGHITMLIDPDGTYRYVKDCLNTNSFHHN